MQTFLPYPSFLSSAQTLDRQRLGKQRSEADQIYRIVSGQDGRSAWANHPAVVMWRGHAGAIALYRNLVILEWVRRGYANNMPLINVDARKVKLPWWIGYAPFHSSHRAALLAKAPDYYSRFGWPEEPGIAYYWPGQSPGEDTGLTA